MMYALHKGSSDQWYLHRNKLPQKKCANRVHRCMHKTLFTDLVLAESAVYFFGHSYTGVTFYCLLTYRRNYIHALRSNKKS